MSFAIRLRVHYIRDMVEMNDDPSAYWNQEAGARWTRAQTLIDAWMEPITAELLRAADLQPGQRVIDVGCGGGTTALAVAEQVGPGGRVLGIDVSRAMLEYARGRSVEGGPVEYVLADAAEHPFEPESTDLIISRFGVMFFVDPVRAFTNLRASLRPGGRMVMACWGAPELSPWADYGMRALPELTPRLPAPDDGPGPFSLSAESRVREILQAAGFEAVRLVSFSTPLCPGASVDSAIDMMTEVGPLSRALAEVDDATRGEMLARVRSFLEREYRDGPPSIDSATWIIHARG